MTLVKCANCSNERDLTYDQIKTVASENRHCPSCGVGNERVVIREERFQPLAEFIKVTPTSVTHITQMPEPSPENEEQGITVGPGGGIQRRPRRTSR